MLSRPSWLHRRAAALLVALGFLVSAGAAQALTVYTDVIGPNFSFTGIQEASATGDPEPLFDQPALGVGDELVFTPTTFIAMASGPGDADSTGSQVQLMITSNGPGNFIEDILISEAGYSDLTGIGTPSTNTLGSMAGFITVLEANFIPTFAIIPFVGTFAPSDTLSLPADSGVTNWTAQALIDVAAQVPNATKVMVSWDNNLAAASEAGTTAKIEKTDARIFVPEPASILLVGLGMALLGRRARRPQA